MTDDTVARLRRAGCVFAEDEAALLVDAAGTPGDLESMVSQRVDGRPLEYILGWAAFAGLRIAVDPGVFVPRRRTEFLVRHAVSLARAGDGSPRRPVIVDLCCGSGALGAALGDALGPIELYAADIDPAAVRCARRNIAEAGGLALEGDLFDPLPERVRGRVGILAANVPYVPTGAIGFMPPEARDHEAAVALDGGADGLDVARRVAAGAPRWLAPGGHLLIETSERQVPATVDAFIRAGLAPSVASDDEIGATVVVGTRRAGG